MKLDALREMARGGQLEAPEAPPEEPAPVRWDQAARKAFRSTGGIPSEEAFGGPAIPPLELPSFKLPSLPPLPGIPKLPTIEFGLPDLPELKMPDLETPEMRGAIEQVAASIGSSVETVRNTLKGLFK